MYIHSRRVLVLLILIILLLATLSCCSHPITSNENLVKELHDAIKKRDEKKIFQFLKDGADPHLKISYSIFSSGYDAFMIANYYGWLREFANLWKEWSISVLVTKPEEVKPIEVKQDKKIGLLKIVIALVCSVLFVVFIVYLHSQREEKEQIKKEKQRIEKEKEEIQRKAKDDVEQSALRQKDLSEKIKAYEISFNNLKSDENQKKEISIALENLRDSMKKEEEQKFCPICFENKRDASFDCGHLFCNTCCETIIRSSRQGPKCPICKKEPRRITKLYDLYL